MVTCDRTFRHFNQRFADMLGWPGNELLEQSAEVVFPSSVAYAEMANTAAPILEAGKRLDVEVLTKRRDGSTFWCRLLGRMIDPHDISKGGLFIAEDITARKDAEKAARQLLLEYQAILDNASVGITFTRGNSFLHCNERFAEMLGWSRNELIGQPTNVIFSSMKAYEELRTMAEQTLRSGGRLDTEMRMIKRDGAIFWCRLRGKATDPGDYRKGTIYIAEDITERKNAQEALLRARDELELRVKERTAELAMANARLQEEIQERKLAEQQIRFLAHHDALTGLPNRRLLEDRLKQAMEMANRHGNMVAVQFIDLDRFKPINDHLGHRIGDLLLQAVAMRLRALLRGVDTVARLGGDEFVLVLPEMHSAEAAGDAAQRVLSSLAQPYVIEEHELCVTPSIGISLYPQHGDHAEALLNRADEAMYCAKRTGRANFQLFTSEIKI